MLKYLIVFLFISFQGIHVFGQKKEGILEYAIEVQARDTSLKVRQQVGLLRNSSMKITYMRDRSRIDFKMGDMYQITSILDWKSNRSLSLFTTPKGKFATKMEATKFNESLTPPDTNTQVILVNETKKILGYECKKAIMKTDSLEFIYWYTSAVKINLKGQSIVNTNIPGFPMEFETVKDGVYMNYKVSNLTFKIPDKKTVFSTIIPPGYTVMSDID